MKRQWVVEKDRVTRLLEKELDKLEALEAKIKANMEVMNTIRKIDPDLARDLEDLNDVYPINLYK